MTLTDRINVDIKNAMLSKDKEKLEALRAIKAALLLASTEKGAGGEVNESAELKVLQKLVKQRSDAAEIYKQQNRADLAEVELTQISYIEPYLPAQMSDAEIKNEILTIIKEINAVGSSDFGKVMGVATKKLSGKADNKKISEIIKLCLG